MSTPTLTVLSVAQKCAKRMGIASPSALLTSTDNNIILMLQMIERTAQELRSEFPWPELQREYTFTLATSTADYALPGDLDRVMMETLWNRTQTWPLLGPLSPQEWQEIQSGNISTIPYEKFRIKYWATKQFFISPTPTSAENGQTCVFEYITKTVFKPKLWVTGASSAASSYTSYNGNIYFTSAGGTNGATPPTHVTGSASDGTVTWVYQSSYFDTITADTDVVLLDEQMMIEGVIWRWKQERGLAFEDFRAQAEMQKDVHKTKLLPIGPFYVNGGRPSIRPLDTSNYPIGDF